MRLIRHQADRLSAADVVVGRARPRSRLAALPLVGVLLVSSLLGFASLTRGHDWGGDFASYIMQARAIIDGEIQEFVQRNALTVRGSRYLGPVAYPWGYPLALVPALWFTDGNPLVLKTVGLGFFLLLLITSYLLFEPRAGPGNAALLVAVMGTWPVLVEFNDKILSDLPFAALSTLVLVLVDRVYVLDDNSRSVPLLAGLGLALLAAVSVRTNGLLLWPTLVLVQVVTVARRSRSESWTVARRIVPFAAIPYAVALCPIALAALVFPTGSVSTYMGGLRLAEPAAVVQNVLQYVRLGADFFALLPAEQVVFGVCIPFIIARLATGLRWDYHLAAYAILTLLLLMFLPFRVDVRYLFPLLPIFVLLVFHGMRETGFTVGKVSERLGQGLTYGFWGLVLAVFLASSATAAGRNLSRGRVLTPGPYTETSREMFDLVSQATEPDAVVAFFKPRVMRMMTDRDAMYVRLPSDRCPIEYYVHALAVPAFYDDVQVPPDLLEAALARGILVEIWSNQEFVVYRRVDCPAGTSATGPSSSPGGRHAP